MKKNTGEMEMKPGKEIGKGRTAELFEWSEGKVIKLFYKEFSQEAVDHEYQINLIVQDVYSNVPRAYDKVEIDGRTGIIYEQIEGKTLVDLATTKPFLVIKEMKEFTKLHVEMHKCRIKGMSEVNSDFRDILSKSTHLDKNQKRFLLEKLEKLPSGNALCHMDYHPDNIMKTEQGLIIIDWITAAMGNPLADVARTLYILKRGAPMSDISKLTKIIIKIFQLFISRIYFKQYKKLTGIEKKDLKEWEFIIMAARLSENIPEERQYILKKLENYLKN